MKFKNNFTLIGNSFEKHLLRNAAASKNALFLIKERVVMVYFKHKKKLDRKSN